MADRIEVIDILRGLALFGVLAINLDTEFRVSLFEQFLPTRASASPLDSAVTGFLKTALEFKAISLFSFLFGMGLAMQHDHFAKWGNPLTLLIRRLLALLAFGLLHLVFIWNGDILTEYALAGFVVLPFLWASRGMVAISAAAALGFFLAQPLLPISFGFPERDWIVAHVAAAREIYGQGAFGAILSFRVSEIPLIAPLHAYIFARTVALMLLGVLVWRSKVIANAAKHGKLIGGATIGLLGSGAVLSLVLDKGVAPAGLVLSGIYETLAISALPVALAFGYAGSVIWIVSCTRYRRVLAWAAPIGRTAFTNYVTQSLLLGLLFYGYGFGLMGRLGVASAFLVTLGVYVAQVFVSRWWLQAHAFGPLEWLWRTVTYGERQTWRRAA